MASSSYAKQSRSYYDPCPTGTTQLAPGVKAIQSGQSHTPYVGIGSGDGLEASHGKDSEPLPVKVCVGSYLGTTSYRLGSGKDRELVTANLYDRVVLLDPQGSPRIIDVFIDDVFYRRVRW